MSFSKKSDQLIDLIALVKVFATFVFLAMLAVTMQSQTFPEPFDESVVTKNNKNGDGILLHNDFSEWASHTAADEAEWSQTATTRPIQGTSPNNTGGDWINQQKGSGFHLWRKQNSTLNRAFHDWNYNSDSWLITPVISLQNGVNYVLEFDELKLYPSSNPDNYGYFGLHLSINGGTFFEIHEYNEGAHFTWNTRTLYLRDITALANGSFDIRLAFVIQTAASGNRHRQVIDYVEVREVFSANVTILDPLPSTGGIVYPSVSPPEYTAPNQLQELIASPAHGFTFSHWDINGVEETDARHSFLVDQDYTVQGFFDSYELDDMKTQDVIGSHTEEQIGINTNKRATLFSLTQPGEISKVVIHAGAAKVTGSSSDLSVWDTEPGELLDFEVRFFHESDVLNPTAPDWANPDYYETNLKGRVFDTQQVQTIVSPAGGTDLVDAKVYKIEIDIPPIYLTGDYYISVHPINNPAQHFLFWFEATNNILLPVSIATFREATGTRVEKALMLELWGEKDRTIVEWKGAVSSDWFVAGNWNPAEVPTPVNDLIVNINSTTEPNNYWPSINTNSEEAYAHNLNLGPFAELTIADGKELMVHGNITLQGGLLVVNGNLNANRDVIIENTANISLTTGELNFFADVEITGSPTMSNSTLRFLREGFQQLTGSATIGGLYVGDDSRLTITSDIALLGDINVTNGRLTQTAGTFTFEKQTAGIQWISGINPAITLNNVVIDRVDASAVLNMSPGVSLTVNGDWTVTQGNYQFNNSQTVIFADGSANITPGSDSYFHNVTLNTDVAVSNQNMVVKGNLDINEQVVTFSDDDLWVQIDNGGGIAYSGNGRIAGKVRHYITNAIVNENNDNGIYPIPVGTIDHSRRVQISYTAAPIAGYLDVFFESFSGGTYGAFGISDNYYSNLPIIDNGYSLNNLSEEGVWVVSPEGTPAVSDGTYNILFDVVGMNVAEIEDYSSLRMIKTSVFEPAANWQAPGSPSPVTELLPGYRLGRNDVVNSYSRWALASNSGDNALPIELYSFTASEMEEEVLIEWITAAEINNSHFVLERAFADGIFVPIARIAGAGNSNDMLSYSHTDYPQQTGVVYYRLTQYDFDGKNETFDPVAVHLDAPSSVSCRLQLYPNPATSHVNVVMQSPVDSRAVFELYSITGRLVLQQRQELFHGNNQAVIRVGNLPAGVYILRIVTDDVVFETQRLVIEN